MYFTLTVPVIFTVERKSLRSAAGVVMKLYKSAAVADSFDVHSLYAVSKADASSVLTDETAILCFGFNIMIQMYLKADRK